MSHYKVEICTNSAESCLQAQLGGAYRVELCAGIPEGGTTPSCGEIAVARDLIQIKLHVIIRPRGGDFLYSETEQQAMFKDIETARSLGADGIVIGCLTRHGDVDMELCKRLIEKAGSLNVTFHRAFDRCRNPFENLEKIITLGCQRLLTSGQQANAEAGIPLLKQLVKQAGERIIIMPGCGVNENNISKIATETGATEFHFSARHTLSSGMLYKNSGISMGGSICINEDEITRTSAERVKQTIQKLDNLL